MGKFDGVLLVSDFDDTLHTRTQKVSQENWDALTHFTREGGIFTVATGRAYRTFSPNVGLCPVNAPVILSNGADLYDFTKEEYIAQHHLPPEAGGHLLELSHAIPTLGIECYHGNDLYIHNPNQFTQRHMNLVRVPWTDAVLPDIPTPWSKCVIEDEYPTLLQAQEWLVTHYGALYEVIFSNTALLECTRKGVTKGGMVLHLASLLGVEREHIYCVGDNQNDIPMLAVSALPFAPENCSQAVKDWGATLVASSEESCLAHVVSLLESRY